jgi:hypothetical protein
MNQLLAKHPELESVDMTGIKTYKILKESGSLQEQWEKNGDGHWIDVTERELLKARIAKEKEELEKLYADSKKSK